MKESSVTFFPDAIIARTRYPFALCIRSIFLGLKDIIDRFQHDVLRAAFQAPAPPSSTADIALESQIRMLEYRNSRLSDSGRKTFSPHIQRIQPHLRQRFVDASFRFLIGLVLRRHFGYDEQLLAGHTARADALAHAALIAVGLRRIDMAIPPVLLPTARPERRLRRR